LILGSPGWREGGRLASGRLLQVPVEKAVLLLWGQIWGILQKKRESYWETLVRMGAVGCIPLRGPRPMPKLMPRPMPSEPV